MIYIEGIEFEKEKNCKFNSKIFRIIKSLNMIQSILLVLW